MKCLYLNEVLMRAMEALGKRIAKKPYVFIIFTCLLSIILGTGIIFSVYEPFSEDSVIINGGKFEENKKAIASLFPTNNSKRFSPLRLITFPNGPVIYSVNRNGGGMINKAVFRDLGLLDQTVRNVSIKTENGIMKFSNLCAIENRVCNSNPITKILPKIEDILNGKYRFKYPVNLNPVTFQMLALAFNLGGVTEDKEGFVENFMAVRMFYHGDDSDIKKRAYLRQWENAVVKEIEKLQLETIDVYAVAVSEVAKDIQQVNENLYTMSSLIVAIVILFSMSAFITNNWIRSKPWLGLAAGASAGLAIMSGFGTMFFVGIRNSDLTMLVAFVVLGTEIDDAFVMVASWRSTNPKDTVEHRLAKTYSEAAVSVTVSSLTSFIAYCVGIAAPLNVVRNVCIQCAICILFTYIYQLLFFGSFMAIDGYREKSERNAFVFCKNSSSKSEDICDKRNDVAEAKDNEELLMKCMRDVLGGLIKIPVFKAICLILFVANLTVASFGIIGLRKGSEIFDILVAESKTKKAADIQVRYFLEYQYPIHIVINKTLNYWEKNVQDSIENMLRSFENHPNIVDSSLTVSWLKYYIMFSEHPLAKASIMSFNISNKENFFKGLRRIFLRLTPADQFTNDINFNRNYTEIVSTRYIVFCSNLTSIADETRLMEDVNAIAEKSGIPIIIVSILFLQAEQSATIGKITMQTIWVTSVLMFVVFLLFIANLPYAILVGICVTSSMVGTVGFMAAWNIKLDILSLIVIVTCLGFSINYSAHMSYSFSTAQTDSSHEKVKESMYRVGLPILQGSLSTIIAVLILTFQDIYIYIACFRIIFLTVMETAFHSLIVLPIVLSIFDSCTNDRSKQNDTKEITLPSPCIIETYHL